MRRLLGFTTFVLLLSLTGAGSVSATTYYIAASGSDSNSGTAKTSPWLHAPGMAGCSGTCGSSKPNPGDQFIFRGGDTWGSSSMPWNFTWAGSSGSFIYLGVDQTWFSGSSWTRPIISCSNSCSAQFSFGSSGNFVQIDNFEFTGIRNTQSTPSYNSVYAVSTHDVSGTLGSATHVKISNNYFHGACLAADGPEQAEYIAGWPLGDTQSEIYLNVIDGSDQQYYSGGNCGAIPSGYHLMCGICGAVANIYENYVGHLSNGMVVENVLTVHDNIFDDINTSIDNLPGGAADDHENAFESNGDCGTLLYNNVVKNVSFTGVVLFQLSPNAGCTSYAFNNVLWNNNAPNGLQAYESSGGGTVDFFNNTAECGPVASPSNECGRATGSAHGNFINNHFITSAAVIGGSSDTLTTNVTQSISAANAQGYTASETYVFSPTLASNATVGAGSNEGNLCNGVSELNATAGGACQNDTTFGVNYNTSNHTVTVSTRSTNSRPTSGQWDAGAYEFSASAAGRPNPPTGLAAVVQ